MRTFHVCHYCHETISPKHESWATLDGRFECDKSPEPRGNRDDSPLPPHRPSITFYIRDGEPAAKGTRTAVISDENGDLYGRFVWLALDREVRVIRDSFEAQGFVCTFEDCRTPTQA